VRKYLKPFKGEKGVEGEEAWCAAHLSWLCSSALSAWDTYGYITTLDDNSTAQVGTLRGMMVNYESLPGIIPSVVLPRLFNVSVSVPWLEKMQSEGPLYSKSFKPPKGQEQPRRPGLNFGGDSADKESRASEKIFIWSERVLGPLYDRMQQIAVNTVQTLAPELRVESEALNWTTLAAIPKEAVLSLQDTQASLVTRPPVAEEDVIQSLRESVYTPWNPFSERHISQPYEKIECPIIPDKDYPKAYPVMDLLNNWNGDNTEIPSMHYDSLCHFDYHTEYDKAQAYRKAEKPFILYNMPELDEAVKRWSDLDFLQSRIGTRTYRAESSKDNHFMYYHHVNNAPNRFRGRDGQPWTPPTKDIDITFESFLKKAIIGQNQSLDEREHIYFRVTSMAYKKNEENTWVFDELPFFKPKRSLWVVDPSQQQGVHCRFGMKSLIAEPHFDGSRNAVAMLSGMRRWVMAHPDQCKDMYLLPRRHPSGRHSEVDWSAPDLEKFPNFVNVKANEIILKAGELLYVPTEWFHYIVSLNLNIQCNTRSGVNTKYESFIGACGF